MDKKIKKFKETLKNEKKVKSVFKSQDEVRKYFNILNPDTGKRYSIPLLKPSDPNYIYEYAHMMWVKEHQPDLFDAIINWR